ncbi:NlpC/P60 family protein, partial [Vibrio sp. YT-19(2023)]
VFFKTRRSTYHVGIYLGNKQFMHASTSKGVIISRIDNPYWASKFWQVRRVTL